MQAAATPVVAPVTVRPAVSEPVHPLREALALADATADVREAAQALRARYARRVVVVDAFDMRDETPAAVGQKVQLYFAASDGHCWHVTTDASQAAGFFIAAKE
jgi:hypothetical protein